MIDIEAIQIWLLSWYYAIEDALIAIFGDDGRRYEGDKGGF